MDFYSVQVTPFIHQVGGHTCVLQVSPQVICKPYQENEVAFYAKIPENFKEFVPYFQGFIDIKCENSDDGIKFHGRIRDTQMQLCRNMRNLDGGVKGIWNERNSCGSELREGLSTWSDECIRRQIDRYGYWTDGQTQQFIMLENLVASYKYPCVMDLKLGRKHNSDYSSEAKKRLLEERWSTTTSASLGFRMCGVQVYKRNSNTYQSHDKYFGRHLDQDGIRTEMRNFFDNGVCVRKDALMSIISKLRRLSSALDTQTSFKLFSCSLLVLYDGDVNLHNGDENPRCVQKEQDSSSANQSDIRLLEGSPSDVRLIDFANVVEVDTCPEEEKALKAGVRFGVRNLLKLLEELL